MAEIVKRNGGQNLLHEDFIYKRDRLFGPKQHWRCSTKGCPGRAHTIATDQPNPDVVHLQPHNHPSDPEDVLAIRSKFRLQQLAKDNRTKPLSQIYRDFVAEESRTSYAVEDDETPLLPQFTACKTSMHRSRREGLPALPTSSSDVELPDEWSQTLCGQRFLLYKDDDTIIFSTDANLKLLSQADTLYMDGTFKSAPKQFKQLYSIHVSYRDHFISVVYCFLTNKLRSTYMKIFNTLRTEMAELDLVFNPKKIMSDFESGLMPAVRLAFPDCVHKGCYFHHTQCIWREVQHKGLTNVYHEDHHSKKIIRMLMAVAFLPILAIRPAVQMLESQLPEDSPVSSLFTYYRDNWLNGNYPLVMWNVHKETTRTNNHVEGWHSKLNKTIGKLHPNIYELIECLKKEQANTELTVSRARLGAAPPPRRLKYREADDRITRLRDLYLNGESTTVEFLRSLRHTVHHF